MGEADVTSEEKQKKWPINKSALKDDASPSSVSCHTLAELSWQWNESIIAYGSSSNRSIAVLYTNWDTCMGHTSQSSQNKGHSIYSSITRKPPHQQYKDGKVHLVDYMSRYYSVEGSMLEEYLNFIIDKAATKAMIHEEAFGQKCFKKTQRKTIAAMDSDRRSWK